MTEKRDCTIGCRITPTNKQRVSKVAREDGTHNAEWLHTMILTALNHHENGDTSSPSEIILREQLQKANAKIAELEDGIAQQAAKVMELEGSRQAQYFNGKKLSAKEAKRVLILQQWEKKEKSVITEVEMTETEFGLWDLPMTGQLIIGPYVLTSDGLFGNKWYIQRMQLT